MSKFIKVRNPQELNKLIDQITQTKKVIKQEIEDEQIGDILKEKESAKMQKPTLEGFESLKSSVLDIIAPATKDEDTKRIISRENLVEKMSQQLILNNSNTNLINLLATLNNIQAQLNTQGTHISNVVTSLTTKTPTAFSIPVTLQDLMVFTAHRMEQTDNKLSAIISELRKLSPQQILDELKAQGLLSGPKPPPPSGGPSSASTTTTTATDELEKIAIAVGDKAKQPPITSLVNVKFPVLSATTANSPTSSTSSTSGFGPQTPIGSVSGNNQPQPNIPVSTTGSEQPKLKGTDVADSDNDNDEIFEEAEAGPDSSTETEDESVEIETLSHQYQERINRVNKSTAKKFGSEIFKLSPKDYGKLSQEDLKNYYGIGKSGFVRINSFDPNIGKIVVNKGTKESITKADPMVVQATPGLVSLLIDPLGSHGTNGTLMNNLKKMWNGNGDIKYTKDDFLKYNEIMNFANYDKNSVSDKTCILKAIDSYKNKWNGEIAPKRGGEDAEFQVQVSTSRLVYLKDILNGKTSATNPELAIKKGGTPTKQAVTSPVKKGQGLYKMSASGDFGNISINPENLKRMVLTVHDKKGKRLAHQPIDYDLYHLLTKRFDSRRNYSKDSTDLFGKLVKHSGLPITDSHSQKFKSLVRNVKKSLPQWDIEAQPDGSGMSGGCYQCASGGCSDCGNSDCIHHGSGAFDNLDPLSRLIAQNAAHRANSDRILSGRAPIAVPGLAGSGMKDNSQSIKVYNDPDQVCERLKVLLGERTAGNDNKAILNEASQLAEWLFKHGEIDESAYKELLTALGIM